MMKELPLITVQGGRTETIGRFSRCSSEWLLQWLASGASQVMLPPPPAAVEMIQGSVEFVQTVDDGEACCGRTVAFACRTKVSSGDHAVVFGGGMHSRSRSRGSNVVRGWCRVTVVTQIRAAARIQSLFRGSQGARLRDRTASRHPHSVPHPWLHSGVLVKTQCTAIVFSPTCVSTWPACWSSKCDVFAVLAHAPHACCDLHHQLLRVQGSDGRVGDGLFG